ncbi:MULTISPECIES: GntR family transcriptional regulator [unclassified Marinovum]
MNKITEIQAPRTSTDIVFDTLFEEIANLKLMPGTKMSEVEIAARMGVSRQPVRDAFNRLGNMGLLMIRPQRATTVRGFEIERIQNARFIRKAVELEVISSAIDVWDDARAEALGVNIAVQKAVLADGDTDEFHALDYHFHRLICELGDRPLAFETLQNCKRNVDRLCMLSLGHAAEAHAVLNDHIAIADALKAGSKKKARAATRQHLRRLDATIEEVHKNHPQFFD